MRCCNSAHSGLLDIIVEHGLHEMHFVLRPDEAGVEQPWTASLIDR